MPNLLNQSKQNESEPRLALQIRNQKQKSSRRRTRTRIFAQGCENSHQGVKFRTGANFRTSAKWLCENFSLLAFVDFFIFVLSFSTFALLF